MTETIRVAQIIGKAVQGGVDTLVLNYYRHIDRSKVQFDFFMDGFGSALYDDEIRALGGRVFKLPPYEKGMRANLRQFREILGANKYKIVHSHMNSLSVFWLREAKRAGVPIRIAHSHSTASPGEGLRTLLKYILKPFSKLYPTHLAACSEYASGWLFGKKPLSSGRVFMIRNAVDIDKFRFDPEIRSSVREKLGVRDKFVVGHVGRFVYQKNHRFLIDVFKQIQGADPTAALLLIGDGELMQEVRDRVREYGLDESVIFLGNRRDVHELYQAMDVFALPSHYEGLPVSAVEAQASGLPCVLSDRITTEALLSDGASMAPLSERDWAERIALCKGHDRKSDLSALVGGGFDIGAAAERLCKYYLDLTENKR